MLIATLAAALLVTQSAQQFDLVCEGETRDFSDGAVSDFSIRYRIDLQRNLWCAADCRAVQPIKTVTPTELTLQDESHELSHISMSIRRTVNRMSGDFHISIRDTVAGVRGGSLTTGQCERAAFTSIPARRF